MMLMEKIITIYHGLIKIIESNLYGLGLPNGRFIRKERLNRSFSIIWRFLILLELYYLKLQFVLLNDF